MKVKNFVILIISIFAFGCDPVNAQDKVYVSTMENSWFGNYSNIISLDANPSTGIFNSTPNYTGTMNYTAAIGYGTWGGIGYIISLQYTSDDKVDIYAKRADNSGTYVKIKDNADIADGNSDLDYVRLGIDANGVGWIVSKHSNSNILHVGSFTWNGNMLSPNVQVTKRGKLETNDGTNAIFLNGDLAFASNVMFILANNGSGTTKIYTIPVNTLTSADNNSTNIITSKWDLRKSDGSQFNGSVNGFAFSSTGSAYLSTSGGIYFIDQTTTNYFGSGTVKCTLSKSGSNYSDLATPYIPINTALPVKIHSVKVSLYKKN